MTIPLADEPRAGELDIERTSGDTLALRLRGSWRLGAALPQADQVWQRSEDGVRRIAFDAGGITEWDTGLLTFLMQVIQQGEARAIETDRSGLPEGVQRLLDLAFAVPETKDTGRGAAKASWLARVGTGAIDLWQESVEIVTFLGRATLSFGRLFTGRARLRASDVGVAIQEAGPEALGIVSLISFLIGLILAFMGAVQLQLFGAEIYVANLVAVGMAREMSSMMTGIVMAGRTGAAYAAQLGTMTVNEEIDSLRTLGLSPMDFLVLPRMIALMLMMPLLALYSSLLGILGGAVVGVGMLGISPLLYWNQTVESVDLVDFGVGLIKAIVVGVLVAIAGTGILAWLVRGLADRNFGIIGLAVPVLLVAVWLLRPSDASSPG